MRSPRRDPTPQQREAIEYGVRLGVARAAEELDVSRGAIYRWSRLWPKLLRHEEEKWEAMTQEERDAWMEHRGRPAPGPDPGPDPAPIAVEVVTAKPKLDVAIPAGTGAAALVMALEQARSAIVQARSVEDLKRVADFGVVAASYAKAERMARELVTEAKTVRVEALTALAAAWEREPKNEGVRMAGSLPGSIGGGKVPPPIDKPTMEARGLDPDEMKIARGLLRLQREEPSLYEAVRTGKKTIHGALRAQYPPEPRQRQAHLRAIDLSLAHYSLQLVRLELGEDPELLARVDAALAATQAQLDAVEGVDRVALLRALSAEMVRRDPGLRELADAITLKIGN